MLLRSFNSSEGRIIDNGGAALPGWALIREDNFAYRSSEKAWKVQNSLIHTKFRLFFYLSSVAKPYSR